MGELWLFGMALAVVYLLPGPDMILLLQTGARQGKSAALATAIGLGIARACHVALAALGLAALFKAAPWTFDAVRLAGADVRDVTFASMRHSLGMVTQDGHLFHETILSNLRLARPEASDDEVWDAVRRARLEPLIRSLPDQLDTLVGERGYRLSGGERQRLTIARLLLAQPRVVILDEATAALDSTSEAAVQAALSEALEGRTAMVIAHRLSTIRSADLILVVEDGSIVERGTHEELLAMGGRYEELHRTQFAVQKNVAADEEVLSGI